MNLFQTTLQRSNRDRPPVWFMRQAGRYHQHYQNLKRTFTFIDLCKKPEVSAEAAMGPIRDFDFDAAILFSDILFPLEVMGMGLEYSEGPKLEWQLKKKEDLQRFRSVAFDLDDQHPLAFQAQALAELRKALPHEKGMIGFVGGPLTLYFYAVEGSHKGDLSSAIQGLHDGRWAGFSELLIPLLASNMVLQANAGADTVAVLDTCAGEISLDEFEKQNLPVLKNLFEKFRAQCPTTPLVYYSKKTDRRHLRMLLDYLPRNLRPSVLGVDWNVSLKSVLEEFGEEVGIQGNIDPDWLFLPKAELERKVREVVEPVYTLPQEKRKGWVFGLGHGILPKTPEENVRFLVQLSKQIHSEQVAKPRPLLEKYNVPGPRYTSYPTVPYWETSPTTNQWIEAMAGELESKSQKSGAALYLHIPFCKSLCTYCGCNTRITRKTDVGMPYISTLLKEFSLYRSQLGKESLPVSEIHLGGGTPTFLSPDEIRFLMEGLLKNTILSPDHELSLEADPRVTTREHLQTLRDLGFRRLSLGIQDFDPRVQESVNRVQTVEEVQKLVEQARSLGFHSVNFDLIYGLPFQTNESIRTTFDAVRKMKPDRIAFYAYAHVPWIKPSQRKFTEADLPDGENKRSLYETGRLYLQESGYVEIGMDHFALPSDSLYSAVQNKTLHRNFMGYTTKLVTPLIGLGVSSIGDAWTAFAQNEKLLEHYTEKVESGVIPIFRGHLLTDEDLQIRTAILNLMTRMETRIQEASLFPKPLSSLYEEFVKDGLMEITGQQIKVLEAGRPFLRNICMVLDQRLFRKQPEAKLFSKTI